MSTSELDEVVTLLERILPDPRGYGERVIKQAALRWADSAQRRPTVVPGEAQASTARSSLLDLVLHRAGADEEPAEPSMDDSPPPQAQAEVSPDVVDVQVLLASALGACECWGLHEGCTACGGDGFPGWEAPDADLFHQYVGPAAARLSASWDGEPRSGARPSIDDDRQPRQGVNA